MADFNFFLNKQGPKGAQGAKGDTGFSPTIMPSTDNDGLTTYKLVITNENNTYETDNLMGNLDIVDDGGTYLRYNREAGSVSASEADAATASAAGVVRLANSTDYANLADDAVMTPSSFVDNYNSLLSAGTGIDISQNLIDDKIMIGITNDVVTNTDLSSALSDYVKNSSLNSILANYITDASLTTTLLSYVTNSSLSSTLASYVTNSALESTLSNYVTTSNGLIPDAKLSSNIARTSQIPDISTKQDTLVSGTNIKTINGQDILGSGNITIQGGSGGTVDQTFNGSSTNAQSGVAIEGAGFLKNTATATKSLTIFGTTNNQNNSILIGYGTTTSNTNSTVIGNTAVSGGSYATALGYYARANDQYATAIGDSSFANYQQATAIGHNSQATKAATLAAGSTSKATAPMATAVGVLSTATQNAATSLGYEAKATAAGALQIGTGTNNTANTLQINSYTLLDTSTGLIPDARISTTIDRISAIESRLSAIEAKLNQ